MGLSTVMQTALTGMHAAIAQTSVTANHLANYETAGFKAARLQLADLPPHAGGHASPAGFGLMHFGNGVQVVGVQIDSSPGSIDVDEPLPLLALDGEGFFILQGREFNFEGGQGRRYYTRSGRFELSADGRLVSDTGEALLGFGLDQEGQLDTSHLQPLAIHLGSTIASSTGRADGLRSYSIGRNGGLIGHYQSGASRTLGQIRLARFTNASGLAAQGGNRFTATVAAGLPLEFDPGENGAAQVHSGALERSNVDIGRELIELTLAGNLFRANAAVFQTADAMLGSMFFPWRR